MHSDDERAIQDAAEAFAEAWNRGDAAAAAAFFAEDAVRVGAFGDEQHGRAEIAAAFARLLGETMPGARIEQERGAVRMLSPDLAVWRGGIAIVRPDGSTLKGHSVQVMQKVGGRWLILETHPKFFPPRSP